MKNTMKLVTLLTLATITAACVSTREPILAIAKQDGDEKLNCQSIAVEYKSNTTSAAAKIKTNRKHDRKELWYGLLIWPGLMDFRNADGHEANALLDRNIRLKEIAISKTCDVKSWPAQPARY
jgi:hypothetical protein